MKTITLRLNAADYTKLSTLAQSERTPMANLLLRLLDQYAATKEPKKPTHTHVSRRDEAMAEYYKIMADLPPGDLTYAQASEAFERIKALRIRGGNIPIKDTPLPFSINLGLCQTEALRKACIAMHNNPYRGRPLAELQSLVAGYSDPIDVPSDLRWARDQAIMDAAEPEEPDDSEYTED